MPDFVKKMEMGKKKKERYVEKSTRNYIFQGFSVFGHAPYM